MGQINHPVTTLDNMVIYLFFFNNDIVWKSPRQSAKLLILCSTEKKNIIQVELGLERVRVCRHIMFKRI